MPFFSFQKVNDILIFFVGIDHFVTDYQYAGAELFFQEGIFYFLWLNNPGWNVFNVTDVLAADPFDPPWLIQHYHFWDEPEMGYYLNTDPYVLRKHASMLSDAGVDMVFRKSGAELA